MIPRQLASKILRDLAWSPIIGLVGSRQVGKTTLVKHLQTQIQKPTLYLDLELQEDYFKLEDAQSYLTAYQDTCVIIDEVQVRPELFALLRALTDLKREPARYILLGSAAPHIVKNNTETLAGRITFHELSPFSFSEIKHLYPFGEHWYQGGFPGSLLAENDFISRKWLQDFTDTFIHRDLNRLGFSVPVGLLTRMMTMVAHLQGSVLNKNKLANSLGITNPTVSKYLDLLEGSYLLRRLQPYFANVGKRLVKSPKIYLRDTGLLHHLLRIPDSDSLHGHPVVGTSWEGYVIEQIIREAPDFSDFYFYRTSHGAEIDLLFLTPPGKMAAIEIKFSVAPNISKGFYLSVNDLNPNFKYVITPAGECHDRSDGVRICSLSHFLEKEMPILAGSKGT